MFSDEIHEWIQTNLFDEVPTAISVITPDFQIVEANRCFRQAYGPWKGRPCYEVYKGRAERCEECAAAKTFADGKIRTREEAGTVRNGIQGHYLVQMVPITRVGGDIPYVIEMSTDITPMKQLEQENREAERLAAVGETVAGVAHGIKNVLMGLEGGMYAVNTGIERGDDERIARGWSILEENIGRISEFVKEFLDFAKGRPAHVALVDPNAVARKVAGLFQDRAAQAGIDLEVHLQEGIPLCLLDQDGIHTCLANLVSNATDACLLSDRKQRHVITISSREKDGTLVYEVADNGGGMDYNVSRKVFSKFFTTKGSNRGTGLGLLITKKIVHQHGGRISFTSKEGEGSTFRILLPWDRVPKPEPHTAARPRRLTENLFQKPYAALKNKLPETYLCNKFRANEGGGVMPRAEEKTVLVVDDEPNVRDYLAQILRDAGFKAVTASDGEEALAIVRKQRPDFISLDLVMPKKTGHKLLYELRKDKDLARIPVVIVTAHAQDELGQNALQDIMENRVVSGPGAYLEKPVKPLDYVHCVQRAGNRGNGGSGRQDQSPGRVEAAPGKSRSPCPAART